MPGPRLCRKPANERAAEVVIGNEWLTAILLLSLTSWTILSSVELQGAARFERASTVKQHKRKSQKAKKPALANN
jgi:hypothetical protein